MESDTNTVSWIDAPIEGCLIRRFQRFGDERGWLAEVFRDDELDADLHPTMGYLSLTYPGVERGPHEHVDQTDMFVFFSGTFRVFLWDSRGGSPTFGCRQVLEFGENEPAVVIVPPGVVHAYRNVGNSDGLIFNCPNRLYAGWEKQEEVDEIRHEDQADSIYGMD